MGSSGKFIQINGDEGELIGVISWRENEPTSTIVANNFFMEEGPAHRISEILVAENWQGRGLGKWLYLKALATAPEGWFHNSQAYPDAHRALAGMEKEGLIEVKRSRQTPITADMGLHLKRITDDGRKWLADHPTPETALHATKVRLSASLPTIPHLEERHASHGQSYDRRDAARGQQR